MSLQRMSQFTNLISKVTDKYFTETGKSYPSQIKEVCGTYPYDGKSETIDISGSTQLPMAPDHTGKVNRDLIYERGKKTLEKKWVSIAIEYEFELWLHQQFKVIGDRSYNHVKSIKDSIEYFVMAFLGYGHTTTHADSRDITGFDSVAQFSASHTLASIKDSPTQSNLFTTTNVGSNMALSADNVKYVRRKMRLFEDDRGLLMKTNPNRLIVPESLADTAEEIVKSKDKAHELSNTTNILKGIDVLVIPELDQFSTEDWYFVDRDLMKQHFVFAEVYGPKTKTEGQVINGIRIEKDYDIETKAELVAADYMCFCGVGLEWRWGSKVMPGV